MLTSCHALEREKNTTVGGHSWRGGLFTKQLKKWVNAVFLLGLGCYGCIFHGTGNSAQLCQNFGISGGGGLNTPPPSVRHWPQLRHLYYRATNFLCPLNIHPFSYHKSSTLLDQIQTRVVCAKFQSMFSCEIIRLCNYFLTNPGIRVFIGQNPNYKLFA